MTRSCLTYQTQCQTYACCTRYKRTAGTTSLCECVCHCEPIVTNIEGSMEPMHAATPCMPAHACMPLYKPAHACSYIKAHNVMVH